MACIGSDCMTGRDCLATCFALTVQRSYRCPQDASGESLNVALYPAWDRFAMGLIVGIFFSRRHSAQSGAAAGRAREKDRSFLRFRGLRFSGIEDHNFPAIRTSITSIFASTCFRNEKPELGRSPDIRPCRSRGRPVRRRQFRAGYQRAHRRAADACARASCRQAAICSLANRLHAHGQGAVPCCARCGRWKPAPGRSRNGCPLALTARWSAFPPAPGRPISSPTISPASGRRPIPSESRSKPQRPGSTSPTARSRSAFATCRPKAAISLLGAPSI